MGKNKRVDEFTLDGDNGVIRCRMGDGTEKNVTLEELERWVCDDGTGMVDASIIAHLDGATEIVERYITFQEYMENEFQNEATAVLSALLNVRARSI